MSIRKNNKITKQELIRVLEKEISEIKGKVKKRSSIVWNSYVKGKLDGYEWILGYIKSLETIKSEQNNQNNKKI